MQTFSLRERSELRIQRNKRSDVRKIDIYLLSSNVL